MTTKELRDRAKRLWNSGLLTDAEYQRELKRIARDSKPIGRKP